MRLIKTNGRLRAKSLIPRTPFLDDFFNAGLPTFNWSEGDFSSKWVPDANIKEDKTEFVVELSVPGYAKKDIHVEIDNNNVLRINGEHEDESKEETDNYTRKEFSYGSFTRSFQLPETVKEDGITAKCDDGVLRVELPKKETAILKRESQEIKIS